MMAKAEVAGKSGRRVRRNVVPAEGRRLQLGAIDRVAIQGGQFASLVPRVRVVTLKIFWRASSGARGRTPDWRESQDDRR